MVLLFIWQHGVHSGAGFNDRRSTRSSARVASDNLMALAGIVSVVFGVLIAIQPAAGLLAAVWLIGIYAIVMGIMYIVVYFESRTLASRLA